jgi:hypothetical protein
MVWVMPEHLYVVDIDFCFVEVTRFLMALLSTMTRILKLFASYLFLERNEHYWLNFILSLVGLKRGLLSIIDWDFRPISSCLEIGFPYICEFLLNHQEHG